MTFETSDQNKKCLEGKAITETEVFIKFYLYKNICTLSYKHKINIKTAYTLKSSLNATKLLQLIDFKMQHHCNAHIAHHQIMSPAVACRPTAQVVYTVQEIFQLQTIQLNCGFNPNLEWRIILHER